MISLLFTAAVLGNLQEDALRISPVRDEMKKYFSKEVEVFGLKLYATKGCPDEKLLHAAGVLAQYLDNDEDGKVDNSRVLKEMHKRRAAMVLAGTEREAERLFRRIPDRIRDGRALQDLYAEEIDPGSRERFDATLEEVLHLVTFAGYCEAYPDQFGLKPGTDLTKAMDIARGGRFFEVPRKYPAGAWYTYDDETCDYGCMAVEYFYWALTTKLGAQSGRCDEIFHEWELCTPSQLQSGDLAVSELLASPEYKLPTVLPDGNYTGIMP